MTEKIKEIRFCQYCGKLLDQGARFCKNCGEPVDAVSQSSSSEQPQFSEIRKQEWAGIVVKCPNCGAALNSFASVCPECGHELRGVNASSSVDELARKLEKIESKEQRFDFIQNFHIPNTKEDIMEFFILAVTNINSGDYDVEAWYTKLDQAYYKARLSFGESEEFQQIDQLYSEAKQAHDSTQFKIKNGLKSAVKYIEGSIIIKSMLLGALGVVLMIIGWHGEEISYAFLVPGGFIVFIAILSLASGFIPK